MHIIEQIHSVVCLAVSGTELQALNLLQTVKKIFLKILRNNVDKDLLSSKSRYQKGTNVNESPEDTRQQKFFLLVSHLGIDFKYEERNYLHFLCVILSFLFFFPPNAAFLGSLHIP